MNGYYSGKLHQNFSGSWAVKFAEINALPGAQNQFPLVDNDALGSADERGFQVGVAVAFTVAPGPVFGRKTPESHNQIAPDIGIGIFIDGNGARGMRAVNGANTVGDAGFFDASANFRSDVE